MMYRKLNLVALTLLLLGALATTAGYFSRTWAGNAGPSSPMAARQTPAATRPDEPAAKPAPGRMFVVGRVLDPQGKPVPGATVTASVQVKFSSALPGLGRTALTEIGHVDADASGRFRVDAPRTSSSRNDSFVAIALAPGFGLGWVNMDPDADQPAADITLGPEQVIEGRLFDVQGRPVQGVRVSVGSIEREVAHDMGRPLLGRLFEGLVQEWTRVNDVPAWPKPAISDADGRFTIHGIGRGLKAGLSIIDPRFPLDDIGVETDEAAGAKIVTATLEPAKIFTGRVTDAQTGKPVPYAKLRFHATVRQRRFSRANDIPGGRRWAFSREPLARRRI